MIFLLVPVFISWGIFIYVVLKVAYPESLTSANTFQIFSFFSSLFLSLSFTINLIVRFMLKSIIVSFGIILILVLKALNSLNIVSFLLTVIAFGLLLSYLKKPNSRLTTHSKVPKLRNLSGRKRR